MTYDTLSNLYLERKYNNIHAETHQIELHASLSHIKCIIGTNMPMSAMRIFNISTLIYTIYTNACTYATPLRVYIV